jgi:Zn ribbon nucleic-acid-binding protein
MVVELDRELTEEQEAAAVLAWRTERALNDAPALFEHARGIASPEVGGTLDGVTVVPEAASSFSEAGADWREVSAPLRITAVDDVDERYVRLIEWVEFWAETLGIEPPAVHVTAWRNLKAGLQGFKASTTPMGARMLVSLLTSWLLIHGEQIGEHESAGAYREDVTEFLFELRQRYPMRARRERPPAGRVCPACGLENVFVDWADDEQSRARVACDECGWEAPQREVARMLRRVS